jgi:hypothetical protein
MYSVPFFNPLMVPVSCKFVFASSLLQEYNSKRLKNAIIDFFIVLYFAAK